MPTRGARVCILRSNLKKHHESGQSGKSNKHPVAAELLVCFAQPISKIHCYACVIPMLLNVGMQQGYSMACISYLYASKVCRCKCKGQGWKSTTL